MNNRATVSTLSCLAVALLLAASPAQTTGTAGTNDFTINGTGSGGTSPVDPHLATPDTSVTFKVTGPPGKSVFGLAAGALALGVFGVPPITLGTLDLDPLSLVVWYPGPPIIPGFPPGNTLNPMGSWTLTVPVAFNGGETFNLQFAIYDPVSGAFSLTQAHSGTVSSFVGIVTTLPITGTTGMNHSLTVPVTYYGVTYNALDVISHGVVKFGSSWSDFSPTMTEFFAGFPDNSGSGAPGVAVAWGDYNPTGGTQGTYRVWEDTNQGTVRVEFANMYHFSGGELAGTFDVTFGAAAPGSVEIDLAGYDAGTLSAVPVIFGVSDGVIATVPNTDLTNIGGFAGAVGTYTSGAAPDSIGQVFPGSTQPPFTGLTFIDIGPPPGNGTWVIL